MLARILARGLTLLLFGFLLPACSSARLAIEYDYDDEANFDSLKSWSWLAKDKSGSGSSKVDKMLHEALVTLLERQGYRHVETGGDFRVGYVLQTRRRVKTRYIDTYYNYESIYYFNGVGGVEVDVVDYREGTLILDVALPEGKQPIWRGWASGAIRAGMKDEQIRAELTEACRQVLEKFPPPATRRKKN